MTSRLGPLVVAVSLFAASQASAQETAPSTKEPIASERAAALYLEARKLAAEDRYAEACPKLEESHALQPAIGTQFNLADCYTHTAKPATALALFREVEKAAQLTGKAERQRAAQERIAILEATVPRIRVRLSEGATAKFGAGAAGLVIRRDGVVVRADQLGERTPVDPGVHVVAVSAAGHQSWEQRVTVLEDAMPIDVVVPPLVEITRAGPPRTSPLKYAGATIAGVGLVAVGVGAVFGVVALNGKSDAGCDGVDCRAAPPGSADTLRDAQQAATLSTVFFVTGAVLAVGGATLWLLAPKEGRGATVGFAGRPGGATFTFGRTF